MKAREVADGIVPIRHVGGRGVEAGFVARVFWVVQPCEFLMVRETWLRGSAAVACRPR